MAVFKFKIEIDQGATYDEIVRWRLGDKVATSVPVDLTGCKARAQFRERVNSDEVLLELTTENGRILLGGEDGTVRILIDAETTAALAFTNGVYDLEIEFSTGHVDRFLSGAVVVSKEVTRGG